jgi:hypothetical protein
MATVVLEQPQLQIPFVLEAIGHCHRLRTTHTRSW